jgi:threonine/homoserine/homoserine lactone efflux protein
MNFVEILALLVFLFPLAFSPGPGNMFFAANGAKFGFVDTLSANFGYHLATILITFFIGLGFSLFFSFIKNQYQYIQILGSLYVIYLAYKFYKAGTYNENAKNLNCTFMDGVVLLLFNPKAYVIISLMFTMFLDNSQNIFKIILISLIFTVNNCVSFTLWTLFGDLIGAKFRNKKYSKILNNMFSLMLFLVGIWMLTIRNSV